MSTSKLAWFRTSLMLASLVIALGLVVISSQTVALAAQQPGAESANAQVEADAEDSASVEPEHVSGNCFAVVSSGGSGLRTNCVIRTARLATGQYEVIFNGSVRGCVYLCTIGMLGPGVPPGGECSVTDRAGNINGVFVATRSSGGSLTNKGFHLGIFCR